LPLQQGRAKRMTGATSMVPRRAFARRAVWIFSALPASPAGADHENFTTSWSGLRRWTLPAIANAAKLCIPVARIPPNILKERVLFTPSEFHSGPKHATTSFRGAGAALAAARAA
jgi:hypothetical protein